MTLQVGHTSVEEIGVVENLAETLRNRRNELELKGFALGECLSNLRKRGQIAVGVPETNSVLWQRDFLGFAKVAVGTDDLLVVAAVDGVVQLGAKDLHEPGYVWYSYVSSLQCRANSSSSF